MRDQGMKRQTIPIPSIPIPVIPWRPPAKEDPLTESMTIPPLRGRHLLSDETLTMVIRLAIFVSFLGLVPAIVCLMKP